MFIRGEPSRTRALLHELRRCTRQRDLKGGREAHAQALGQWSSGIATELVNMYTKCGSLVEASKAFDQMKSPGVVPWTILMLGYVDKGQPGKALELFTRMKRLGCEPDGRTYVAALKACTALAGTEEEDEDKDLNLLEWGCWIHSEAAARGYDRDMFVSNTAMDMFAKCGRMVEARRVFESMEQWNAVSWTVLMLGYVENGENQLALETFERFRAEKVFEPDGLVYTAAFKACAGLASSSHEVETGMEIHRLATSTNSRLGIVYYNTLVDMFAKYGRMEEASRTFAKMPQQSVVTFTVLILGYVEHGQPDKALGLFESLTPPLDSLVVLAAVKACSALASAEKGELVDGRLVKLNSLEKGMRVHSRHISVRDSVRVASSLMDMYARCHSLLDVRMVFDRMFKPGIVSWNNLLLAYTDCGEPGLALHLFASMQDRDIGYDPVTLVAALKACACTADVESAKAVHSLALRSWSRDWSSHEELENSLVDAYGKCGSMFHSQLLFDSLATASTFTWSALVAGYSRRGDSTSLAFRLFGCMLEHGLKPDGVLFLSLLSACSHAGEVSKGEQVFREMKDVYGIRPEFEHYRCMIDMLGRSNRLDAAVGVARSMPFEANVVTWRTILGACSKWKNVRVARLAFERLVEIDNRDVAAYYLMENICASLGLWDEHSQVEAARRRITDHEQTYSSNSFLNSTQADEVDREESV